MSIAKLKTTGIEEKKFNGVLLILDDEKEVLNALSRVFRGTYNVEVANNTREAFKILSKSEVKVILADQRMPDMKGTEFFCKIKGKYKDVIKILITGYSSLDDAVLAINEGEVYSYLAKPWNLTELKKTVQQAFDKARLIEENWIKFAKISKEVEDKRKVIRFDDFVAKKKKCEMDLEIIESYLKNQQILELNNKFANSVAQEINKPVNGILNHAQTILEGEIDNDVIKEHADEIIHETERIGEIISNLSEFDK